VRFGCVDGVGGDLRGGLGWRVAPFLPGLPEGKGYSLFFL
jgi:hypothetical protein